MSDVDKFILTVSPVELFLVLLKLSVEIARRNELSHKMDNLATALWELLRKMKFVSLVVKAVKSVLQLMCAQFAHFQQILKQMGLALVPQPTMSLNKLTNCCA